MGDFEGDLPKKPLTAWNGEGDLFGDLSAPFSSAADAGLAVSVSSAWCASPAATGVPSASAGAASALGSPRFSLARTAATSSASRAAAGPSWGASTGSGRGVMIWGTGAGSAVAGWADCAAAATASGDCFDGCDGDQSWSASEGQQVQTVEHVSASCRDRYASHLRMFVRAILYTPLRLPLEQRRRPAAGEGRWTWSLWPTWRWSAEGV